MRYVLLLGISLFACFNVLAQQSELTEEQRQEIKKQITADMENLGLDEDQKPEYRAISQKYLKQLQELRSSDSPRRIKFREAKRIRSDKNVEMKALLSEEQYEIYLEIQERRREEMKERRKG